MTAFPTLAIAVPRVAGAEAKTWDQKTVEWADVLGWLPDPADVKEAGGYVLGVLRDGRRSADTVVSRGALTLDADYPGPGFVDAVEELGCTLAYHSTYRATLDSPRYRVIIPLAREVSPAEYEVLADALMGRLGVDQFDRGSRQPERFMYRPGTSDDLAYEYGSQDGPLYNVEDALLVAAAAPAPRVNRTKRNPLEIEGIVGDFCRAYDGDWEGLIGAYELPYAPARGDRWSLVGTHGAAGMGPVAGSPWIVYSHHEADPAYDTACSAFDLVRLHRFSELDAKAAPKTPITKLPSYAAMVRLAADDARVQAGREESLRSMFTAVEADAVAASPTVPDALAASGPATVPPADPPARLPRLVVSSSGKVEDTDRNRDEVMRHDPVFRALRFNEMTLSVELAGGTRIPGPSVEGAPSVHRVIPPEGSPLDKGDIAAVRYHLERAYGLRVSTASAEEMLVVEAMREVNRYSPVRDYLLGLRWDGVARVETSLPGVADSPYTRLVARRVLASAVARALEPGVKWDHMLVLYGTEGLGKTHWIDRMSRGFSASLGRIGDKDTLLTMQRSWIMTADESASLKQSEFDAQKEFLTRTADTFRAPYDPRPLAHPRHCVIWGTTNDPVFLRRQEGNRRFLIVHCEEAVDFDALTDEYVDQVWAEAVQLYRAGERLFFDAGESALASSAREPFIEEDPVMGIIEAFVETLVPSEWGSMSPADRAGWYRNHEPGSLAPVGSVRIDEVCSAQIWVEAMGLPHGERRRRDLLDITAALRQLPGWYADTGRRVWTKEYGTVLMFRRVEADPLL